MTYIWQNTNWPHFTWDTVKLIDLLAIARKKQGLLLGKSEQLDLKEISFFLSEEAVTTSEIEGQKLDRDSVRSSVARHLGLPTAGLPEISRETDGLVQLLMNATKKYSESLDRERLWAWQAALFPTGYSGIQKIQTGAWRSNSVPMLVISGSMGKEHIHYQAPDSTRIDSEIDVFINWWNNERTENDGIIRAAIAHFWFVSIHPFEDGNGRIARAITDMALAQDEETGKRLYSLSSRINREKTAYYDILEQTQKGSGDLTDWLYWFLEMFSRSIDDSLKIIDASLFKNSYYKTLSSYSLNERQKKVIGKMLDFYPQEFTGGLTNKKYVSMTKVSPETAKRDLKLLLDNGIIIRNGAKGRSTSYRLNCQLVENQ